MSGEDSAMSARTKDGATSLCIIKRLVVNPDHGVWDPSQTSTPVEVPNATIKRFPDAFERVEPEPEPQPKPAAGAKRKRGSKSVRTTEGDTGETHD